MNSEKLKEALEIAQSETLEMEALEVMRNPAYGTCYEIAEAFLKTKRSLIELSKENEELKKESNTINSMSEGKRMVYMLKNALDKLRKENEELKYKLNL